MDASTDPRTRVAWAAATQSLSLGTPSARLWRRLLAELDPDEVVLHLDVLTEGSRDACVAVTPNRLLSWSLMSDRFRRMPREKVKVVQHQRTVDGVLRLSDGSSKTPWRLKGRPEQRAALLRALRLPPNAQPIGPVALDLSTSPKTKVAYAASPIPPPATGAVADEILDYLGSAKAQLLVRATLVGPAPLLSAGPAEIVVLGTGAKLWFVPAIPTSGTTTSRPSMAGVSRGGLRWEHRGSGLVLFYDRYIRSDVAVLHGRPAALAEVVNLVSQWAATEAAAAQKRAAEHQVRRVTGSDGTPATPKLRRRGLLRRKRAAPIRTWKDAENAACAWLRDMGFRDAAVTPAGADVGVDVTARKVVAQVKWEATPAGRPKLQQLHGAAAQARKKGAFFSRSGYTEAARTWAEQAGMAAFVLTEDGALAPVTTAAKKMMR